MNNEPAILNGIRYRHGGYLVYGPFIFTNGKDECIFTIDNYVENAMRSSLATVTLKRCGDDRPIWQGQLDNALAPGRPELVWRSNSSDAT